MTTSALVVSRNIALALRLEMQQIDVIHLRPDGKHPGLDERVDAVILDLGDPQASREALLRVREARPDSPVLILGTAQHDWTELLAQDASITIGRMPLSPSAISALVKELVAAHGKQTEAPAQVPQAQVPSVVSEVIDLRDTSSREPYPI